MIKEEMMKKRRQQVARNKEKLNYTLDSKFM